MSMANKHNLVANCLICDDIRFEMGGKYSINGIYGGDITVQGIAPSLLPKLVFILQIFFPIEYQLGTMTFRIRMRDTSEDLFRIELPTPQKLEFPEDATKAVLRAYFPISPFPITGPGILEVFVDVDSESIRAARLEVRLIPPSQPGEAQTIGVFPFPAPPLNT